MTPPLSTPDLLALFYMLLLFLAVLASNTAFVAFIGSKPEGRKTVLGENNELILHHCSTQAQAPAFSPSASCLGLALALLLSGVCGARFSLVLA